MSAELSSELLKSLAYDEAVVEVERVTITGASLRSIKLMSELDSKDVTLRG